jgi:hypothetical protein
MYSYCSPTLTEVFPCSFLSCKENVSTAHIYTQTIYKTTQNKQYIEQHKNLGRVRAVPRLGELCPDIFLTTEKKARENLSQGS